MYITEREWLEHLIRVNGITKEQLEEARKRAPADKTLQHINNIIFGGNNGKKHNKTTIY